MSWLLLVGAASFDVPPSASNGCYPGRQLLLISTLPRPRATRELVASRVTSSLYLTSSSLRHPIPVAYLHLDAGYRVHSAAQDRMVVALPPWLVLSRAQLEFPSGINSRAVNVHLHALTAVSAVIAGVVLDRLLWVPRNRPWRRPTGTSSPQLFWAARSPLVVRAPLLVPHLLRLLLHSVLRLLPQAWGCAHSIWIFRWCPAGCCHRCSIGSKRSEYWYV